MKNYAGWVGYAAALSMSLYAGGRPAYATSVSDQVYIGSSGPVVIVDGKDRDATVHLHVKLKGNKRHDFRFGYFDTSGFRPLTGWGDRTGVNIAGGSIVDFALVNKGADGSFGTSDDKYYRLSDAADYADLYYRRPIGAHKSRSPVVADPYYNRLLIAWDIDKDGARDISVMLRARGFDGLSPTAVPLPAAVWLLGSGLLAVIGAAGGIRRKAKSQSGIQ